MGPEQCLGQGLLRSVRPRVTMSVFLQSWGECKNQPHRQMPRPSPALHWRRVLLVFFFRFAWCSVLAETVAFALRDLTLTNAQAISF